MQVRIAGASFLRVVAVAEGELRGARKREDRSRDFTLGGESEVLRLKKDKELILQRNSRHDRVRLAFQRVFDNSSGYRISLSTSTEPQDMQVPDRGDILCSCSQQGYRYSVFIFENLFGDN